MCTTLSTVIPNYNGRNFLERCLASIYKNPPSFPFDVVVVDNASADGSAGMVKRLFPKAKLIANSDNKGFGPAANQGLRAVDAQYLFLLNSDTEVLPGTLDALAHGMEQNPDVAILGPEFTDGRGEIIQMSWGWHSLFWGEFPQKFFSPRPLQKSRFRRWLVRRLQVRPKRVPIVYGAGLLIRRKALDDIGLIDENLVMYFEESDLCLRAWKKGWAVLFYPNAKVVHHLGRSSGGMPAKMSLIYRQSQLYYYDKHGSHVQRRLIRFYLRLKFWRIAFYKSFPRLNPNPDYYDKLEAVLKGTGRISL
jgi:N-acetylglucosaminyl-diphospho-decaprenol L-rhamnosyltransferase